MQPGNPSVDDSGTRQRCVEDNIGYVMLSEILRAQSHSILTLLRKESPDLNSIKRIALKMHISTDNLGANAGLIDSREQNQGLFDQPNNEPASVQSIVEMCEVAASHRLSELQLDLHYPESIPAEKFALGDAWELAYVLFLILVQSGKKLASSGTSVAGSPAKRRSVILQLLCEQDFVDLVVPNTSPLSPHLAGKVPAQAGSVAFDQSEWRCLQRLVAKNNAHLHEQRIINEGFGDYGVVLRIPTFHPGHEEPLDFLKVVDLQNGSKVKV
ncbi:MAG: hypothetical protein ACO3A4_07640 [Silvanigrellaceae bacterium]